MGLKSRSTSAILAALAALFILVGMPHAAYAAFDVNKCQTDMPNAIYKYAQIKSNAANQVFTKTPQPDIKQVYCWDQVMSMFNTVGTITDPFNLIWQLVYSFLQGILNQVCQSVVGAIKAGLSFIQNLTCLPMPGGMSGGLGLGSLGVSGMTGGGGSCNGVSLIGGLMASPSSPVQPGPNLWQIWGLKPQ